MANFTLFLRRVRFRCKDSYLKQRKNHISTYNKEKKTTSEAST